MPTQYPERVPMHGDGSDGGQRAEQPFDDLGPQLRESFDNLPHEHQHVCKQIKNVFKKIKKFS